MGCIELGADVGRIAGMAKKKPSQDGSASKPASERAADRHASPFMVRLPDVYRQQLRELQKVMKGRLRFAPPMTALIQQAIEDLLVKEGLWPPVE